VTESTHVLHCRWCGKPLERDHVLGEYYDPSGECRCHPLNSYSGWMGGRGFHEPQNHDETVRIVAKDVPKVPEVPNSTNLYD